MADFENNRGELRAVHAKKVITIRGNLRVLKIHTKDYSGHGLLHNFMIEEVHDYGPSNVGKFARCVDIQAISHFSSYA